MITSRVSKPTGMQNPQAKLKQQEQERLRREFVAQIKKEVESATYEIKSEEIAEKVSQKIREDTAIPQIFKRFSEY